MAIIINGDPVRLVEASAQDVFEISGAAAAEYQLTERDQADPAGRYRWLASGDIVALQRRSVAGGWSSPTNLFQVNGTGIGLYTATPVARAAAIAAPTGGVTVDAEARTAINSIRTALTNIGVTS